MPIGPLKCKVCGSSHWLCDPHVWGSGGSGEDGGGDSKKGVRSAAPVHGVGRQYREIRVGAGSGPSPRQLGRRWV